MIRGFGSVWWGLVRYATEEKKKKSSRCIFNPCRASAAGVLPLQGRTTSQLSPYKLTTKTDTNVLTHTDTNTNLYKCIFSSAAGFCLKTTQIWSLKSAQKDRMT